MHTKFKNYLINATHANDCKEMEVIQSLWSGYGKISRYKLFGAQVNTVVVKCISLKTDVQHPRGWNTSISHERKMKSYQVETNWYKEWNHKCNEKSKTPKFIGSYAEGENQWIILEDLDEIYPLRKEQLTQNEIRACLSWLAYFHMNFLGQEPNGLWKVGTYWHLDTRPDELEEIQNQDLKRKAQFIDQELKDCKFQTLVHGDAKLANFCFSRDGSSVAAVDFQYVGRGSGMKDIVYFLGSCFSSSACEANEEALLEIYFSALREAYLSLNMTFDFKELEEEWRRIYPIAWTDFTRFLLGWMPTHQKVNDYSLKLMNSVLNNIG